MATSASTKTGFARNAATVANRIATRETTPVDDEHRTVDPEAVAALALAESAVNAERAPSGPTRTKTIQDDYSAQMYRRFRRLKGLVRETVATNDALRLGTNAEPARDFGFVRDPEKVDAFLDWLQTAVDDEILEVTRRVDGRVAVREEWQNVYIRRAYGRGVEYAQARLREQGVTVPEQTLAQVFNTPIHADALGVLYTRNFRELQGITEAMGQQISRVLTDGFAQGWNPRKMAGDLNDRVDKIGLTRARTLARTETINAHSTATLNRFEEIAGDDVRMTVKAEWLTAGDPCPICAGLEGTTYTLEEARGLIPIHPNCRCAYIPVVESASGNAAEIAARALEASGVDQSQVVA